MTRLESGNEVTVHHGQALIRLAGGGSIRLCQPMKVSLLKSAGGLTVAFDRGTLRIALHGGENFSLLAPWFTIAAPREDRAGERSVIAGLDSDGKLCLKTIEGEWLAREQLGSGQLAVPAGNEFIIEPNMLTEPRRASDTCACPEEKLEERPIEAAPQAGPASNREAAPPATAHATVSAPMPVEGKKAEGAKSAEPEWKAIMPPLVYEAQPGNRLPSAEAKTNDVPLAPAILVPVTWQGVVTPAGPPTRQTKSSAPRSGFVERIKNFFRSLFGGGGRKSA